MIVSRINAVIRVSRREEGMTLIEVIVAALILALAAMATFGILIAATRNAQRAQATQVALDKAQEEMEKLQTLTYSQLALTKAPPPAASVKNPNSRVNSAAGTFAVHRDPPGEYATMVVEGGSLRGGGSIEGSVVKPGPIRFEEGNVSGTLYRYIVWRNDPSCPESETDLEADFCPGNQDFKQLVVAVKLDAAAGQGERSYAEVQSQLINPKTQAQRATRGDNNGGPGSGDDEKEKEEREKEEEEDATGGLSTGKAITAQQFFLSDTPCSLGGVTSRVEISGDHLLHNTLGTCASGLQTGSSQPGAPDALLTGAPPDPAPEDDNDPGRFDYASDSYLEPTPDTDKGLQIMRDDTSGCHYDPTSTVRPEAKVHRWVTDPLPADFKVNGIVTLEFHTRSLNDASYPGRLCVFLFQRRQLAAGEAEVEDSFFETKAGTPYWTVSKEGSETWPQNSWTELRLTMDINGAPLTIPAGDRLGIALSVDPAATPVDAIPVIYDHPDHATRIEVDTTTPLEGG